MILGVAVKFETRFDPQSLVACSMVNVLGRNSTRSAAIVVFAVLICVAAISPAQTSPQSNPAERPTPAQEYWNQRQEIETRFASAIESISRQCSAEDLSSVTGELSRLVIRRNPQRQYIFLPSENPVADGKIPSALPEELRKACKTVLTDHAESLFELAKQEVARGHAATAFQLLHEVLFFDPNHETARRVLGHRLVDVDGVATWRVAPDRLRIKPSNRPFGKLNWPANTWLTVSTPHFQIASRAGEEETRLLAEQMERWHDVWRQVFFDFYNRPINLQRWLDGTGSARSSPRKFEVVFFGNRAEYVAGLARDVPGVEASTGFYNDQQQTSFFFAADDPTIRETWRHELTHQLFQESRRGVVSPFADEFLWLGEGIAMYFESLVDFGDHLTLGGFDSRRLQYARLRRIKEKFHVPLAELSGLDREAFQARDDIAKIYSQSAGVAHYLMNAEYGALRQPLISFLQLSYQGKLRRGSFEKLCGRSLSEIDVAYSDFIGLQPGDLTTLVAPEIRRELCLIGCPLEDADGLSPLSACSNLIWLDLSACDLRGSRLRHLRGCVKLKQLFLNKATIDAESLRILASLPIVELDVSGTDIDDQGLILLARSRTLVSLDVSGSRTSEQGRAEIQNRISGLKVICD